MPSRLAIFHPPGRLALTANPFGKDVANLQLFQALARHGGFEQLDVLSVRPTTDELAAQDLFQGLPATTRVSAGSIVELGRAAEAGALLRGHADLYELAWQRRRVASDRAFSLAGLVHTIAPPTMRQLIAMNAVAPMHPWDALVCTSPAVRDGLSAMFDGWGEHLADRTGGRPPARPALPVVPLGVDAAAFAPRPDLRAQLRAELGLGETDVLILWVGRLSFFEKAFPQPMFAAVQHAAQTTRTQPTLAMAGWFPREGDLELYQEAARAHAPDVKVRFEDGNDRDRLAGLWSAADIFLSLADNIQETFGITPLEAMAAGLPIVASDWDGYRFTVRDGIEGFLAPTLMGPAAGGVGLRLSARHVLEVDSYQGYVGAVAQHTAVHIGRAGAALAQLIPDPELRRRMGQAAQARVATAFDWPIVARAYAAMFDELAEIRFAAPDVSGGLRTNPVKGDPFADFSHFATAAFTQETRLCAVAGVTASDVRRAAEVRLDVAFPGLRASPEACAKAFEAIAQGPMTVLEVLLTAPLAERRSLELGLAWMAKYGFIDWLA